MALVAVLVLAGCAAEPSEPSPGRATGSRPGFAFASTPSGQTLSLEVRRSLAERARGMMGRTSVPEGTGMLFVFEHPARHSFWMKGCLIPLDIVWLEAGGEVVDVEENAPPCETEPCPSYRPESPARYVIEVGGGRARELGMVPGARVLLGGLEADDAGNGADGGFS